MTRENKLALVVGFGLILFVGILISDHFSTARMQYAADLTSMKHVIDPLSARSSNEEGHLIDLAAPPPPAPEQSQPLAARAGTVENANPGAAGTEMPRPEQQTAVYNGEWQIVQESQALSNGGVRPIADSSPRTAVAANSPVTLADPSPGNYKLHEVHAGESFFGICRQYYNDVTLVKALAKYNNIDDPALLRAGQKLRIPPIEEVAGRPVGTKSSPATDPGVHPAAKPASAPSSPATAPPTKPTTDTRFATGKPAPAGQAATYTVKAGDSLASIAQRFLGSQSKWRKIYEMNREIIDDPDDVKVGTVLRLL
jgi:nucleoid-associated protein YgaU